MTAELTVVIPAFNAAKTISSTLQSIAKSSCIPHELIVVNDGSTDNTVSEVNSFISTLNIRVVNQKNQGISGALNTGMQSVQTQYVARLDADDLVHPQRFEKQVKFLLDNPQIDVLGSSVKEFGNFSSERHYPKSEIAVLLRSTHSTVVAHPSLMARTQIMKQFKYDSNYDGVEDHELWCRMLTNSVHITNQPEVLTYYRVHSGQITSKRSRKINALKDKVNSDFAEHEYVRSRLFLAPIAKYLSSEEVRELAVAIIKSPIVRENFRFQILDLLRDSRLSFRVRLRLCSVWLGKIS